MMAMLASAIRVILASAIRVMVASGMKAMLASGISTEFPGRSLSFDSRDFPHPSLRSLRFL